MTLTKKKWMALLVAMTMVFTAVGLGLSTSVASAATKAPKKIYLKATAKTVDIKGKVTVSVSSVSPKSASKSVTWKSSNKRIATVSSKGTVTGKRSGKVKITATSKKNKRVKKSITITVKNLKPKVYGLPSNATVYTGTKKTLKARMGTGVYNKGITWKSSNSNVAYVSPKGVVTLKKKGSATITAYAKESKKYKDTCKLTVRQSATSLKFSPTSLEFEKGTTVTKKPSIAPSNVYSQKVTYASSNTSVATVNKESGVVKGIKPGTATITATTYYGAKKSASYKVTVYDVLKPTSDGTYALNKSSYGSYRILATNNGVEETLKLSNSDIDNIWGTGNAAVDWDNAIDVRDNFEKVSFKYTSGGDYVFEKKGNKVYTKFGKGSNTYVWNYDPETSFEAGPGVDDYTMNLYLGKEVLKIKKTGHELVVEKANKSIRVEKQLSDGKYAVVITVKDTKQNREAKMVISNVTSKQYNVKLDTSDISKFHVKVYAYR